MYSQNSIPSPAESHPGCSPVGRELDYEDLNPPFQRPTAPTPGPEEYSDAERQNARERTAFDKLEDPPRSAKKRYICGFSGCSNPSFNRKCEYT